MSFSLKIIRKLHEIYLFYNIQDDSAQLPNYMTSIKGEKGDRGEKGEKVQRFCFQKIK